MWNLIIKYAFIGDKSAIGHAEVEAALYKSLGLQSEEPEEEEEEGFITID
jgi:hypothetical protein